MTRTPTQEECMSAAIAELVRSWHDAHAIAAEPGDEVKTREQALEDLRGNVAEQGAILDALTP